MLFGDHVLLPNGRVGTIVFKGLIGEGIKWGIHFPKLEDFEGTYGDLFDSKKTDFEWEPDALLRDPWEGCEQTGWEREDFVGETYIRIHVDKLPVSLERECPVCGMEVELVGLYRDEKPDDVPKFRASCNHIFSQHDWYYK
jgi:hypothetical protein